MRQVEYEMAQKDILAKNYDKVTELEKLVALRGEYIHSLECDLRHCKAQIKVLEHKAGIKEIQE